MQHYNGKKISDGTGQELWTNMYTIAYLDEHLGKQYWLAVRQTSSPAHAITSYMDHRRILGDNAVIEIIKPNQIKELTVVK